MAELAPDTRINLTKASILLVDASAHSLDVTAQILKGFGVSTVHRFSDLKDAVKFLAQRTADLFIIDPSISNGEGYECVRDLRHSGRANASMPVILVCGHVRKADLALARDSGANFVVAKPLAPVVLLQRLLWVAKDTRPFVDCGSYIGPDRRFKFEGPPAGSEGRRAEDLKAPLGDATEPNLSQDEVNAMLKPQRVII
ncbi:response regulator [Candidatus Viadribacter manganicus]|uniref:Response regulatory domain-containing protein n=1 Tax=Candidatus Viadribacter manganicus TaxID=1759059 RepID=A0A1B1AJN5_9PROT|nr:response regulator [Candidatus Viadribacter manganicus]ANP46772.1 hypothetical protein ATE48_13040 [Candidatus Viadribacter manganicus]